MKKNDLGGKMSLKVQSFVPDAIEQGSQVPGPRTGTGLRSVRNRAAQQEVSGRRVSEASSADPHRSHYCLNHPPPTPPSMEKLSSTKPVPGAKNIGDR